MGDELNQNHMVHGQRIWVAAEFTLGENDFCLCLAHTSDLHDFLGKPWGCRFIEKREQPVDLVLVEWHVQATYAHDVNQLLLLGRDDGAGLNRPRYPGRDHEPEALRCEVSGDLFGAGNAFARKDASWVALAHRNGLVERGGRAVAQKQNRKVVHRSFLRIRFWIQFRSSSGIGYANTFLMICQGWLVSVLGTILTKVNRYYIVCLVHYSYNFMITIKIKELSEKLGKTILEIAEDTGLNRNTVTALFHNKVDGIKFETIEKICTTYDIPLAQLIEMKIEPSKKSNEIKPYRQEGEGVPFTLFSPFVRINCGLGNKFEKHFIYYAQKGYFWAYWDFDEMNKWSNQVYRQYSKMADFDLLYAEYERAASKIENIYLENSGEILASLNDHELAEFSASILVAYDPFWDASLFIDSFDAGFDQEEIKRIAQKNNLSVEDTVALTTTNELSIDRERKLALLKIARTLLHKRWSGSARLKMIKDFVEKSTDIKNYVRHFDYYQSNYAVYRSISNEEIVAELDKYLSNPEAIKMEIHELETFSETREAIITKILRQRGLKVNPLAFFQKLTAWRESRKKYNLMGIVAFLRVLQEIERRTGIPVNCLSYLNHNEVASVLKGVLTKATLEDRRNNGAIYIAEGVDYRVLYGDEALSLRKELENKIGGKEHDSVIAGKVASQGFAKGIVCVVRTVNEFSKFKEGQILVTGMTRPEFVPLMKKAAGIVTNEGGITSHAAIVSRELGKPCIIGTKNATELLHDGDLVEVRALHGTVRILEKAPR